MPAQLGGAALAGVGWWQRRKRRSVDIRAGEEAERAATQQHQMASAQYQAMKDQDPIALMGAMERTFEANDHPAAPIDCCDGSMTVLILFDPLAATPTKRPVLTPSGRFQLEERAAAKRHQLYVAALASTVLATVKETFATCPGLEEVRVLVVRRNSGGADGLEPYGEVVAIYAARFPVERVRHMDWVKLDPVNELRYATSALLSRNGRTLEIGPLVLDDEPEIEMVMSALGPMLSTPGGPPEGRSHPARAVPGWDRVRQLLRR